MCIYVATKISTACDFNGTIPVGSKFGNGSCDEAEFDCSSTSPDSVDCCDVLASALSPGIDLQTEAVYCKPEQYLCCHTLKPMGV